MAAERQDLVEQLLIRARDANRAFVNGDAKPYQDLFEHSEDISFPGPFGGPPLKGWAEIGPRMTTAAALFKPGAASSVVELVSSFVSGDLAVLGLVERSQVKLAGQDGFQPWNIRVTLVFRRKGGEWRVVHRHAEPLTGRRSVDANLDLMRMQ